MRRPRSRNCHFQCGMVLCKHYWPRSATSPDDRSFYSSLRGSLCPCCSCTVFLCSVLQVIFPSWVVRDAWDNCQPFYSTSVVCSAIDQFRLAFWSSAGWSLRPANFEPTLTWSMSTVHIQLPHITFSFCLSIVLAYHHQKGGLCERYEIIQGKVFERGAWKRGLNNRALMLLTGSFNSIHVAWTDTKMISIS